MRLLLLLMALCAVTGCRNAGEEKYEMSDAQLHLTAQQAEGRHLFNRQCRQCHEAYTTTKRVSFSLAGLYSKPELPSGIPANDARVGEVIVHGKRMMPATSLDQQQLAALLAYLHTL